MEREEGQECDGQKRRLESLTVETGLSSLLLRLEEELIDGLHHGEERDLARRELWQCQGEQRKIRFGGKRYSVDNHLGRHGLGIG